MSVLKKCSLLAACLVCAAASQAQYYSWGPSPANVRWRQLNDPQIRLVYPADFESEARRVKWYLDTARAHIDFGYPFGTMRTPVVLHTQNMMGNGMVMWAPLRMELLTAPGTAYSEPRLKQLAIHEYRHNVQYNNLRRGVIRPLTWLLGEQAAFLGVAQFSIFATEGDAVMAETEMSAFGRGLQPSWTMHYRAVGDVGGGSKSTDYWFSGSYRDYVPDHYRLGYQMVRWSYDHYGEFIWDDVARYVARNPQFIVPVRFGLRKLYGTSYTGIFRNAFADLNAHWNGLPRVEDSSRRVPSHVREHSYTTYRWPQWVDSGTIVSFKGDLRNPVRLVSTDVATGRERTLAYTGVVSSRPVLADGLLWWTEYRRSVLWDERTLSRLCSYDLASGRLRTHRLADQLFYPTPTDRGLACVVYDYSGGYSIVHAGGGLRLPAGVEVGGLAWDDATGALCFIGIDDAGMFLARVRDDAKGARSADGGGFERLTPSRHISIDDLRAAGGTLYFSSIASGRDEAHSYDLATGTEHRLTTSAYGSFQPSTPTADGRVALTTYDRHGYHLAVQDASAAVAQEQRQLPVDLVNPPWKRWNVPVMDSMVYRADEVETAASRRFSRAANIFRPHSWLPADYYPPRGIDENEVRMNFGATVMSQSLLSDATSWLSYGWGRDGGAMLHGGLAYNGLGPLLEVDFSWGGGQQLLYTPIPAWLPVRRKRQLSVTTRLSLPMTLTSGGWVSSLSPSIEYNYNNGLIFRHASSPILALGAPSGLRGGELTRGVERLSMALRYTATRRTALSQLQPRWGVTARVGYVTNPTNDDFMSLWSASAGLWLPGAAPTHGTRLRAAWQRTVERDGAPFMFQMKELFPRGAVYGFATREWNSAAVDYQLPVWYPEGGIPGLLYFKRVRVDAFADVARWRGFDPSGPWNSLGSYGAQVSVDMNPLRMPATNNFSVTFTLARPSDSGKPFFSFGMEMPL